MHNWWIASLEHAGIWTREQAEHVSNSIRLTTHRENYKEAYEELKAILDKGKFDKLPLVTKLETEVASLKDELEKGKLANPKKT